jgi:hypothetical protein
MDMPREQECEDRADDSVDPPRQLGEKVANCLADAEQRYEQTHHPNSITIAAARDATMPIASRAVIAAGLLIVGIWGILFAR